VPARSRCGKALVGARSGASLDMDDARTLQMWIDHEVQDSTKVARYRQRLAALGWFMEALKEPLARMANKEDDCEGTFGESRFRSIAILDEEALLATCATFDLNPVAATSSISGQKYLH